MIIPKITLYLADSLGTTIACVLTQVVISPALGPFDWNDMSQHISYTDRRNQEQNEPIYIGFDQPKKKPKKPSNAFGAAATFFGVVGLLSTGIAVSAILTFLRDNYIIEPPPFGVRILIPFAGILISALALFCAFIGMFKKPRRYAILGGVLGFIPIAGVIGLDHYFDDLVHRKEAHRELQIERQLTDQKIHEAVQQVIGFEKAKDRWPDALEGNRLVIRTKDSWDNELRYEADDEGFTIRSAGPDGQFETPDDCKSTTRIRTVYATTKAK